MVSSPLESILVRRILSYFINYSADETEKIQENLKNYFIVVERLSVDLRVRLKLLKLNKKYELITKLFFRFFRFVGFCSRDKIKANSIILSFVF